MARKKNDTLKRPRKAREYRRVFWLSPEGQTERDYFNMDVFRGLPVSIKYPKDVHPSRRNPSAVLKRFQKALRENDFRKDDEAWLLVDADEWGQNEFAELLRWAKSDERHHLAVSNPKFELFLVMHFEQGNGCTTPMQVDARLRKCMPGYDKRLKPRQFCLDEVMTAAENARVKRVSCSADLPDAGMTDVYKLIHELLGSSAG
ncbi:MAG: RloB family protein [Raoultibacter sp.]